MARGVNVLLVPQYIVRLALQRPRSTVVLVCFYASWWVTVTGSFFSVASLDVDDRPVVGLSIVGTGPVNQCTPPYFGK